MVKNGAEDHTGFLNLLKRKTSFLLLVLSRWFLRYASPHWHPGPGLRCAVWISLCGFSAVLADDFALKPRISRLGGPRGVQLSGSPGSGWNEEKKRTTCVVFGCLGCCLSACRRSMCAWLGHELVSFPVFACSTSAQMRSFCRRTWQLSAPHLLLCSALDAKNLEKPQRMGRAAADLDHMPVTPPPHSPSCRRSCW